jgi:enoyl-[acyl-carrier protein] reductase II
MFKTEICEIFGIQYPIILGGMVWVGKSALVAAVSDAGGLGLLGTGGMPIDEIIMEIERVKQRTSKPFGVNIPLVRPDAEEMINVSIDKGASVISTGSGSPKKFTRMIKDRGQKVMHVVSSVSFAEKCADVGVDVIVAEGYEAGGHNGFDETTTMALTPQIVNAVDIPVVAAGGISDGRGFVAALALGAKGVQMGTRFLATHESAAHPDVKQAVINLKDNGTCITGRTTVGPTRSIRNRFTDMIVEAEKKGTPPEKLFEMVGGERSVKAFIEGDCVEGSVYCGQIAGNFRELKGAREVIDDIIKEAERIVDSLHRLLVN